jgi:hypothetical protein
MEVKAIVEIRLWRALSKQKPALRSFSEGGSVIEGKDVFGGFSWAGYHLPQFTGGCLAVVGKPALPVLRSFSEGGSLCPRCAAEGTTPQLHSRFRGNGKYCFLNRY